MTNPPIPAVSYARSPATQEVLGVILRRGPVSRAELARMTGLSKQTTSDVTRTLMDAGWIRVDGQVQGAVGRSATTFAVRDEAAHVLAVDLGGTKLHVALANLAGTTLGEVLEATDPGGGPRVVAQIAAAAHRLLAESGLPRTALRAAVVGSPGVFEPRTGRILISPNIPGLDAMDVGAALAEGLGCTVQVENDVNLAAEGEHLRGCCVGIDDFAFVALGTGIGMGLVANGQLVRGASGGAGEIAYLPLGADPFDARLFRQGTLESAVGSAAILDRYHGLGGAPAPDVRTVFARVADGDGPASAAADEVARILVQACLALRALLDPARVVFGGSIGSSPVLLDRVRALMARLLPQPMPVVASALGSRAALAGGIGLGVARVHADLLAP